MKSYLSMVCTSRCVTKILQALVTNPDKRFRVRRLAAEIHENSGNVAKSLQRLTHYGFVVRDGSDSSQAVYYSMNPDCSVVDSIRHLVVESKNNIALKEER